LSPSFQQIVFPDKSATVTGRASASRGKIAAIATVAENAMLRLRMISLPWARFVRKTTYISRQVGKTV
jgi:hypothetical protein